MAYRVPMLPITGPRLLVLALALPPGAAAAQSASGRVPNQSESFGAVVAPASLPSGASAVYVYAGAQEIAAGSRHGLSLFEVEARARFNYFLLAISAELLLRHTFYRSPTAELAPYLGAGFVFDSGSRYAVKDGNFQYTGIRALGGLIGTYRIAETVRAVGELDIPLDIALNAANGYRFFPLGGGGVEVYLGSGVTGLLMGQLGVDLFREPQGVPVVHLGYQFRVGLGFRLF